MKKSLERVPYLPYNSNRYTSVLSTSERPIHRKNDIKVSKLYLNVISKNYPDRARGSYSSHITQIVILGNGHMEPLTHCKFDGYACLLYFKMITKNYNDRSTWFGTTHISPIAILGSWTHGTSDSFKIW